MSDDRVLRDAAGKPIEWAELTPNEFARADRRLHAQFDDAAQVRRSETFAEPVPMTDAQAAAWDERFMPKRH